MMATASALRLAMTTLAVQPPECLTETCACGFVKNVTQPLPGTISHSAIYTRSDGVVDWHDSQEFDTRLNHEVGGTHIGLVYNQRAYAVLADLLAHPE
jgi:hypothetical protein